MQKTPLHPPEEPEQTPEVRETDPPEEKQPEEKLNDKIEQLLLGLQKSDMAAYVEMYRHPLKMFGINIWMGIGRGIGYLMGFAIGGTILVYILNQIVEINIPLIGDFIADIVEIVQNELGQTK